MASKTEKSDAPKKTEKKKMPTEARKRLAALMLDALDFGGKQPKPSVKQNPGLKRERASGMTEPSKMVAADLRLLVEEFLQETRNGYWSDDAKKFHAPRDIDAILKHWRERAAEPQNGRASTAVYATFVWNKKNAQTDFERRVLSLYDALGGPYAESAGKEDVKRARVEKGEDEMGITELYSRAIRIFDRIARFVHEEERLNKLQQSRGLLSEATVKLRSAKKREKKGSL
jgi:hypothetical protein